MQHNALAKLRSQILHVPHPNNACATEDVQDHMTYSTPEVELATRQIWKLNIDFFLSTGRPFSDIGAEIYTAVTREINGEMQTCLMPPCKSAPTTHLRAARSSII